MAQQNSKVGKFIRVTGDDRKPLAQRAGRLYQDGKSIREVAAELGRSYGATYSLIEESGVPFRPRGNHT